MTVTPSQESAFLSGTVGIPMESVSLTILLILYSLLYVWVAWVIFSQWRSWSAKKIDFFVFLLRSTRSIVIAIFLGFLAR